MMRKCEIVFHDIPEKNCFSQRPPYTPEIRMEPPRGPFTPTVNV